MNPYESPRPVASTEATSLQPGITWPASLLLVLTMLWGGYCAVCAAGLFHIESVDEWRSPRQPVIWLVPAALTAAQIPVAYATVRMLQGSRHWADIGCCLAIVPVVTPGIVLGIPFSIWISRRLDQTGPTTDDDKSLDRVPS